MRTSAARLIASAAVTSALVAAAGCDVALFPETAQYQEEVTARATINVLADAMPGQGVQEVEVEIGQVLLHRPADDGWVVVGAQTAEVLLDGIEEQCAFEDVPVGFESYDAVRIVVDAVSVRTETGWERAELIELETVTQTPIEIGADVTFDLSFDLEASLAQEAAGWSFVPVVDVTSSLAPH